MTATPDACGWRRRTVSRAICLAPRLAQFQMSNPQVQLSIDCGLWIGSMLEAEPDLYLEMTEAYSPDLVSMPIATLHYAAFASREYLDLYGTPKTIAELTEHRTIRHTSHREQRSTWNPKAAAIGQLAQNHFISNSSAATFQAVRAGAGIASLPTYVTTIAPELVMLELGAWGHPVLFLRHHGAIEQKRRVKLVKDWLQEVFDPTYQPWFRSEFIHPDDFARYTRRESPGSVERKGVRRARGLTARARRQGLPVEQAGDQQVVQLALVVGLGQRRRLREGGGHAGQAVAGAEDERHAALGQPSGHREHLLAAEIDVEDGAVDAELGRPARCRGPACRPRRPPRSRARPACPPAPWRRGPRPPPRAAAGRSEDRFRIADRPGETGAWFERLALPG